MGAAALLDGSGGDFVPSLGFPENPKGGEQPSALATGSRDPDPMWGIPGNGTWRARPVVGVSLHTPRKRQDYRIRMIYVSCLQRIGRQLVLLSKVFTQILGR